MSIFFKIKPNAKQIINVGTSDSATLPCYNTVDEKFRFQSDTCKLFYNMIIRRNSAHMESIF